VLLRVPGIVFRRLSLVHCVEIELGVVVLDRLEVHSEGLLDAVRSQLVDLHNQFCIVETHLRGPTSTGFAFSSPLIVVSCHGVDGRVEAEWRYCRVVRKARTRTYVSHAAFVGVGVVPDIPRSERCLLQRPGATATHRRRAN
jgi:hypothetical protein